MEKRISLKYWLCLLGFGVFLSVVWYRNFEIGQIDNSQTLTFMNMFRDSTMYPDMFLLKQAYPIHLYSMFYLMAGLIGKIVDPYWGLYGYFIAINCLCLCGMFKLAYTVTHNIVAAFLSVLALTLQWQWSHALGGSSPLGVCPYPDALATGMLLFSLDLFLKRRYSLSFALTGLVFNVHASFSIFILMAGSFALAYERRFRELIRGIAVYAICALPLLVFMTIHPLQVGDPLELSQWRHIMRLVVTSHTMPFHFGFGAYAKFVPYLMIGYLGYRINLRESDDNTKAMIQKCLYLAFGIALLCLVGVVSAEFYPITSLIKMTIFRSTRFLVILAVIVYMKAAMGPRTRMTSPLYIALTASVICAAFPVMYLALVIIYWKAIRSRSRVIAYCSIGLLTGMMLYACRYYGVQEMVTRSNFVTWAMVAVILGAMGMLWNCGGRLKFRGAALALIVAVMCLVSPLYPAYADLAYYSAVKDVQLWVRNNTKAGGMVVYPPYSYIWSGLSERGDFFNACQLGFIVYAEYLGGEVSRRMGYYSDDVMSYENGESLRDDMTKSYDAWSKNTFMELEKKYGVGHAVVSSSRNMEFPLEYSNAYFKIYRIDAARPGGDRARSSRENRHGTLSGMRRSDISRAS